MIRPPLKHVRTFFGAGLLIVLAGMEAAWGQTGDAQPELAARVAITRGLELVQTAARNYPEHRDCFSCHHQTLPMLAMVTARKRGFKIDDQLLKEQAAFTREFYHNRIDSVRKGEGIGGRGMTAAYALWTFDLAESPGDETIDALVTYLLKTQTPEGRWKRQSLRPPLEETDVTGTSLAAYYMDRFTGKQQDADRREAVAASTGKARKWIAETAPESQEGDNFKLLAAAQSGQRETTIKRLRQTVLKEQREDGGWGQVKGMASDAYATGQTVYILNEAMGSEKTPGDSEFRAAIDRGVSFLLEDRKDDGSWHVVTRSKPVQRYFDNGDPHGKDQFISTAATAWAVSALASTLPQPQGQPKPNLELSPDSERAVHPRRDPDPLSAPISFNRDIRPILSDKCFQCHGPDQNKRKAKLRLDLRESAIEAGAIIPGKPGESELVARILHSSSDEKMPPPDSGRSLSEQERQLLITWISQGAAYEAHWAFLPPERPQPPPVANAEHENWPRNAIDRFIFGRLETENLEPSEPASRERLIRRLSFDLTGLPPTLSEIDAFTGDDSTVAIEKLIDRLLMRESYGEHMAVSWLDAARYADTNGYNNDTPRYNWRWRDWVIGAFNRNLPYDQFLTEQIAGDLIPGATLDQKIATGFNRNHNVTSEGGIIDEEYRLEYVADRVHTTATVFMALSIQCARCHDHKFDPVTQKEYYQFSAFFNQVPETGYHKEHVGNPNPVIAAPTREQRAAIDQAETELESAAAGMLERERLADAAVPEWEARIAAAAKPESVPLEGLAAHYPLDGDESGLSGKAEWVEGKSGKALKLEGNGYLDFGDAVRLERDRPFSYGAWIHPAAGRPMNILSRMRAGAGERGFDLTFENGPISVHLIHDWPENGIKVQTKTSVTLDRWTHVFATCDGSSKASGLRIYFDGVAQDLEIQKDALTQTIVAGDAGFRIGKRTDSIPFAGMIDDVRVYLRELDAGEVEQLAAAGGLRELLATKAENRTTEQTAQIRAHYLKAEDPIFVGLQSLHSSKSTQLTELKKALPTAMIMQDQPEPRDTFVLMRGDYDKPGARVDADVPSVFQKLPEDAARNRLGLARWLSDPAHPLTARVAVNRLWHQMFGAGIVDTLEDFGSQGSWPAHPDLLDWLAVEFVESGWDVKAMLKLIANSATYQQSARVTPELLKADPQNRLLARGPRFRLGAEMIRDNALAISGLLHQKVGGMSVRPYQPAGLWTEVIVADDSYSGGEYQQDSGENLYRRGVYTWWKRTCPPPALNTFDAPDREFCTIRRSRTNTPLQALVVLNDPTFVEASRALAQRAMTEGGESVETRATFAFRLATSRRPRARELTVLTGAFERQRARFSRDRNTAANELLAIGESQPDPNLDPADFAAWTTVASMILNLDESLSR